MNDEQIIESLAGIWHFEPGSRVDLERTGVHTFRATEVRPNESTGKRIIGYLHANGGIVSWQEPDLTFEQARVFHTIAQGFTERIREGEATNEEGFLLIRDGECPVLFHPFDFRPSIAGNVRDGLLPIWQSWNDLLASRGYRADLVRQGDSPWEIWAAPLNTPPASFERE